MAATSSASHKVAGHKGLGLLSLTTVLTPENIVSRIQRYRNALAEAKPSTGVMNRRVAVSQLVHCAATMAVARANATDSMMWFHKQVFAFTRPFLRSDIASSYRYLQGFQRVDTRNITSDHLHEQSMVIVGDPA